MLDGVGWQEGGADEFSVGGERLASQALLRFVVKPDAHGAVVFGTYGGVA